MITTAETYHVPVLLHESIDGLAIKRYNFCLRYKLSEHLLVGVLPWVKLRLQKVEALIPYAFRIEH